MASPSIRFVERKDQAFYHDIRVFIMGADVTPWLMGSVSLSREGVGGMNQVSLTLSNHSKAFEMTLDNLKGKFRTFDPWTPAGQASELAKKKIYDLKNGVEYKDVENLVGEGRVTVPRNFKHQVQSYGTRKTDEGSSSRLIQTSKDIGNTQTSFTERFPFTIGSSVFHKHDQIRVFMKNPLSKFFDQWTCEFTGYIDSKPLATNYVNGESFIRITALDIRTLMQKMRVQTNPSAQVGNENVLIVGRGDPIDGEDASAGFFNDTISKHYTISNVLGGLTFVDSIKFLTVGKQAPISEGFANTFGVTEVDPEKFPVMLHRVGKLSEGVTINYDPGVQNRSEQLERWNNIVIFGQDPDIEDRGKLIRQPTRFFMDWEEMIEMGRNTHPFTINGGQDNPFSADAAKVHMLLPAEGHPNTNLVNFSPDTTVKDKISWASRLELLYEICENIDYQMYVTGWGDIVFEFPMYDFDTDDFGAKYQNLYSFEQHTSEDEVNEEEGDGASGLIVTSEFLFGPNQSEVESKDARYGTSEQLYNTIFSNVLASRIGVNMKTIHKPGIATRDQESAQAALARFGFIEFNKIQAEFNKYSFSSEYRPFISINRPIHNIIKDRIGTLNSLTYNWNIRQDASLSLNLKYVRRREYLEGADGLKDFSTGVFRSITGGESTPISYNKIYIDDSVSPYIRGQGVASTPSNSDTGGSQEGDNN